MSEKLKRIEFKNNLADEEIVSLSRFLITRTGIYREAERSRLHKEVVEQGATNRFARHEAAGRSLVDVDEVTANQEFSTRMRWLNEGIWQSYYELMARFTSKSDRPSMISMAAGYIGIKPVFLEQHWDTDDLDDSSRDYTEFQYVVADPETIANPPLAEEIKAHLFFATAGASVSDSEIPRIETFGTIGQEQLRDILPA